MNINVKAFKFFRLFALGSIFLGQVFCLQTTYLQGYPLNSSADESCLSEADINRLAGEFDDSKSHKTLPQKIWKWVKTNTGTTITLASATAVTGALVILKAKRSGAFSSQKPSGDQGSGSKDSKDRDQVSTQNPPPSPPPGPGLNPQPPPRPTRKVSFSEDPPAVFEFKDPSDDESDSGGAVEGPSAPDGLGGPLAPGASEAELWAAGQAAETAAQQTLGSGVPAAVSRVARNLFSYTGMCQTAEAAAEAAAEKAKRSALENPDEVVAHTMLDGTSVLLTRAEEKELEEREQDARQTKTDQSKFVTETFTGKAPWTAWRDARREAAQRAEDKYFAQIGGCAIVDDENPAPQTTPSFDLAAYKAEQEQRRQASQAAKETKHPSKEDRLKAWRKKRDEYRAQLLQSVQQPAPQSLTSRYPDGPSQFFGQPPQLTPEEWTSVDQAQREAEEAFRQSDWTKTRNAASALLGANRCLSAEDAARKAGRQAREKKLDEIVQTPHAQKIQRLAKVWLARQELARRAADKKDEEQTKEEAAIKLQAWARGNQVRAEQRRQRAVAPPPAPVPAIQFQPPGEKNIWDRYAPFPGFGADVTPSAGPNKFEGKAPPLPGPISAPQLVEYQAIDGRTYNLTPEQAETVRQARDNPPSSSWLGRPRDALSTITLGWANDAQAAHKQLLSQGRTGLDAKKFDAVRRAEQSAEEKALESLGVAPERASDSGDEESSPAPPPPALTVSPPSPVAPATQPELPPLPSSDDEVSAEPVPSERAQANQARLQALRSRRAERDAAHSATTESTAPTRPQLSREQLQEFRDRLQERQARRAQAAAASSSSSGQPPAAPSNPQPVQSSDSESEPGDGSGSEAVTSQEPGQGLMDMAQDYATRQIEEAQKQPPRWGLYDLGAATVSGANRLGSWAWSWASGRGKEPQAAPSAGPSEII